MLIIYPDKIIYITTPNTIDEIDKLISERSSSFQGNAYVMFMDQCLERIQEILDIEKMFFEDCELIEVKPLTDINGLTSWTILR